MPLREPIQDVLKYGTSSVHRGKVRRYYDAWRAQVGMPPRCDNPDCSFHTGPLEWNGRPLKLILDHVDGNARNNSANNLRLLCPNCDSQLETRGGGNAGRIQGAGEFGYSVQHRDGRRDVNLFPPTLSLSLTPHEPEASSDS